MRGRDEALHILPLTGELPRAIALNLKGIAREDRFLHLEKGDQFADAYRVINPQMVVPTLIDGDVKLFQSLAILEYLDEAYPEPPLLPADPLARAWVRGLALINVADSHPLIVPRVRHYLTDVLKVSDDQRLAWIQHWLGAGLQAIETLLAEHSSSDRREPHGRGHLPRHPSDAGQDLQSLARPLSEGHAHLRHVHGHPGFCRCPPVKAAGRGIGELDNYGRIF
jgi:hypothetical protein